MIFEGIFLDHRAKRSCIEIEKGGPSTEPWGTPQERVENAAMESLIETA